MTDADLLRENGRLRKENELLWRVLGALDQCDISFYGEPKAFDEVWDTIQQAAMKTTQPEATRLVTRSDLWQAMIDAATEGKT